MGHSPWHVHRQCGFSSDTVTVFMWKAVCLCICTATDWRPFHVVICLSPEVILALRAGDWTGWAALNKDRGLQHCIICIKKKKHQENYCLTWYFLGKKISIERSYCGWPSSHATCHSIQYSFICMWRHCNISMNSNVHTVTHSDVEFDVSMTTNCGVPIKRNNWCTPSPLFSLAWLFAICQMSWWTWVDFSFNLVGLQYEF